MLDTLIMLGCLALVCAVICRLGYLLEKRVHKLERISAIQERKINVAADRIIAVIHRLRSVELETQQAGIADAWRYQ